LPLRYGFRQVQRGSPLRVFVSVLAILALLACAPRGNVVVDPAAAHIGAIETVFVGSSRGADTPGGDPYGSGRAGDLTYLRLDVSVPPDRRPGEIAFPPKSRKADPATDFVAADEGIYAGLPAFRSDLSRALKARPRGQREAVVFVHGFNNNFAEGTYRLAQLGHDLGLDGVLVHYSWPSKAHPLAYVYDRDSALFARDGLEELLNEVVASGAERILLIAHSLGSHVVMETLRQSAIAGNSRVLDRISGVVLMSPDLDVDVFRFQARRIGELPQPFVIFTSRKDRALSLSARLTGRGERRLGNIETAAALADLKVTVLDTTAFSVGGGHFNTATSPALLALLGRIADVDRAFIRERAAHTGLLPGAILTFQNATEIVLSPVVAITGLQN